MKQNIAKKLKEKKGFTLIEMIIVIAIIAILIALIVPNLQKFLKTAKETKADASAKTLYTSASTYLVEKYTKGDRMGSAVWTQENVPQEFLDDYFNEEEIGDDVTYTITIVDGAVEKVEWKSGDGTGTYPKKKQSSSGGGENTNPDDVE